MPTQFNSLCRKAGKHAVGILVIMTIFTGIPAPLPLAAQSDKTPEYYVKAGYIANFARLVVWPEAAFSQKDAPIVLCVLNPAPFGDALSGMEGKKIRDRRLSVRTYDSVRDARSCHILFINSQDRKLRERILGEVAKRPVLLIGESPGFAEGEGMINFFNLKNTIRFQINNRRAERAGLKISSRLLKLGKVAWCTDDR